MLGQLAIHKGWLVGLFVLNKMNPTSHNMQKLIPSEL